MARFGLALLAAVACSACRAPAPELEPATDCSNVDPGDPDTLPSRVVALGQLDDSEGFVPWSDGEQLELVIGPQGAAMLVPWVELPVEDGDGDEACWLVTLEHIDGQGQVDRGHRNALVFERVEDAMRTGPVFDPVDEADWGQAVRVRVIVTSESFSAVHELDVELDEP